MRSLEPLITYLTSTGVRYGEIRKVGVGRFSIYNGLTHTLDEAKQLRDWLSKLVEDAEHGV